MIGSRCCTYARWFARPLHKHACFLLDIPVSATCVKRLHRFLMDCHRLPRDEGSRARPEVPGLPNLVAKEVDPGMGDTLSLSVQNCCASGAMVSLV